MLSITERKSDRPHRIRSQSVSHQFRFRNLAARLKQLSIRNSQFAIKYKKFLNCLIVNPLSQSPH
ncbi:hypothetical protein COO91_09667 (plasmid) [Nostoc flagelliforme CCNUN1]|uniref:Uncharacterized protein n=1 Tax=Nostoc flagelliforme CCNUN1 TaxID=2038116 RepID=A0A2K8T705_9NOSO|nr:hypothetical protein COO91_09667 [Nostoc flagelliforme CCNUN1]